MSSVRPDEMDTDVPTPWDAFDSIDDVAQYAGWDNGDLTALFEPKNIRSTAKTFWLLHMQEVTAVADVDSAKVAKLHHDSDFQVECLLKLPSQIAVTFQAPGYDFIEQHLCLSSTTTTSDASETISKTSDFHINEPKSHSAFYRDELLHHKSTSGSGSLQLLQHVQQCHRKWVSNWGSYLAPYIAVVGPSGIGKSFSVRQLAVSHGLYVSYVSFGKKESFGYPPRSQIADVCDYIKGDCEEMEGSWKIYLQALLRTASCAKTLGISCSDFWDMQVKSQFSSFQAKLSAMAQGLLYYGQGMSGDVETRAFVSRRLQCFNEECTQLLKQAANEQSLEMLPVCNTQTKNHLQFVLAFDEARSLIATRPHDPQLPRNANAIPPFFRAFRSALRYFDISDNLCLGGECFALLIDTTPEVAKFSPQLLVDLSQKCSNPNYSGYKLFPPFYRFHSLDLFSPWPPDINCPDLSWKTLFSHGRPMFGALICREQSLMDSISLACEKTYPSRNMGPGNTNLSEVRYLSQLLYRVSFNVIHQPYAVKLVSAWMHFLVYASNDRECVAISQPIEPLLALAAKLNLEGTSLRRALVDFKHNLKSHFVSVGDIGEFVASIILLKAFDTIPTDIYKVPLCVPLNNFLVALLGQGMSEQISQQMVTGPLKRLGMTGQVFFNRIIQFSSPNGPPSVDDMFYLYTRCCACFFPPNTTGTDILIPVWIPAASETQPAHMGCILIQVKNRTNDNATSALRVEATYAIKSVISYLGLQVSKTPVLGLMLCLQKQARAENKVEVFQGVESVPIVLAVGLDSSVYPCLADEEDRLTSQDKTTLPPPPLVTALGDLLNIRPSSEVLEEEYVEYVTNTIWEQR